MLIFLLSLFAVFNAATVQAMHCHQKKVLAVEPTEHKQNNHKLKLINRVSNKVTANFNNPLDVSFDKNSSLNSLVSLIPQDKALKAMPCCKKECGNSCKCAKANSSGAALFPDNLFNTVVLTASNNQVLVTNVYSLTLTSLYRPPISA